MKITKKRKCEFEFGTEELTMKVELTDVQITHTFKDREPYVHKVILTKVAFVFPELKTAYTNSSFLSPELLNDKYFNFQWHIMETFKESFSGFVEDNILEILKKVRREDLILPKFEWHEDIV